MLNEQSVVMFHALLHSGRGMWLVNTCMRREP
jgi:hypothetical protein